MIAFIYLFFVVNNVTINDIAEAVSIVESNRNDKAIGDNGIETGFIKYIFFYTFL